jgi:hypothetical protein
MVDMVKELEIKKKIAQCHIDKVNAIEADTAQDEGNYKGILISYTRGFKKIGRPFPSPYFIHEVLMMKDVWVKGELLHRFSKIAHSAVKRYASAL